MPTDKRYRVAFTRSDSTKYDDYPSYAATDKECRDKLESLGKENMTKINEVYDLTMDHTTQMGEPRAWHPPA